ncbi:MAG: Hsp20/alpha crystallin family protein [Alphaproteobacteria bacterium]|nr:Hsp20/alpha crystallin family protein [Alphaproteobacteria bacterium]
MIEKAHTAGWLPDLYEPFRNLGRKVANWFAPKSEASVSADTYQVVMELPGVEAENVQITAHGNDLTIRGEKKFEHEESGKTYFFSEREYGAFQRTFRLPPDADHEAIEADFGNGVLTVKMPKQSASKDTDKNIKINVA